MDCYQTQEIQNLSKYGIEVLIWWYRYVLNPPNPVLYDEILKEPEQPISIENCLENEDLNIALFTDPNQHQNRLYTLCESEIHEKDILEEIHFVSLQPQIQLYIYQGWIDE